MRGFLGGKGKRVGTQIVGRAQFWLRGNHQSNKLVLSNKSTH